MRNDFDLTKLAKKAILGTDEQSMEKLFDDQTTNQINLIAAKIDQPAQDAKLVIAGQIATDFNPGQNGQGTGRL